MTHSSKYSGNFYIVPDDLEYGGLYHDDIIGEMKGPGGRLVVLATDLPTFTGFGPQCFRVGDELFAVVYSRSHIEGIHHFMQEAEGCEDDHEVTGKFVATLMQRSVMALVNSPYLLWCE